MVPRVVVAVAAIEVQVRVEAMLPQVTHLRVILLLQEMPLPQGVEAPEAEQAEAVAEAADVAGVAQLPNLLYLKPLKLH
jgi:hypothetical protein